METYQFETIKAQLNEIIHQLAQLNQTLNEDNTEKESTKIEPK